MFISTIWKYIGLMYMKILKEKYSIYCVFLVFSILSWFSITHTKKILNQMENPISLVGLMSVLTCFIVLFTIGTGLVSSPDNTRRDIESIKQNDLLILVIIGLVFTIGRVMFSSLLKHHDPRTIKISGYMISTLVSGGALYVMKRRSFTASRYLGFALMAFGGYLFIV